MKGPFKAHSQCFGWDVQRLSELEVEAEPQGLCREVERGWAAAQCARRRGDAVEAVVEVFDPGGQVRRQHVLDAGPGHPAPVPLEWPVPNAVPVTRSWR